MNAVPAHAGRSAIAGTNDESRPCPAGFWPIRSAVLKLLGKREYPLWQRLFLLGVFCRRLDETQQDESAGADPGQRGLGIRAAAFMAGLETPGKATLLGESMDKLVADPSAQLDIVLRLAGLMLHKSNVRPRFVECVQAFTSGIGNGPGATLDSLTEQYTLAHHRHFAPFVARYPHILENFVVNTIIRCQFPFGKEGMRAGAQPHKAREFTLLAAQFTLLRGLLTGVAGFHGAAFSEAHVVHTVQAASKHFEHHPEFLPLAHALLVEARMDGPLGAAILLRNPGQNPAAANQAVHEPTLASALTLLQSPPGERPASPSVPAA